MTLFVRYVKLYINKGEAVDYSFRQEYLKLKLLELVYLFSTDFNKSTICLSSRNLINLSNIYKGLFWDLDSLVSTGVNFNKANCDLESLTDKYSEFGKSYLSGALID